MSDPTTTPPTRADLIAAIAATSLLTIAVVLLLIDFGGMIGGQWAGLTWIWWAGMAFLVAGIVVTAVAYRGVGR